ncbi:TPA: hypothetical protein ACTZYL_002102, partial [Campylobacter coli]
PANPLLFTHLPKNNPKKPLKRKKKLRSSAGKFLKNWNLEKWRGYYDPPPYKCRVPNPSINPKKPRNTKRYSNQQKVNKPPTKYGKYIDKK